MSKSTFTLKLTKEPSYSEIVEFKVISDTQVEVTEGCEGTTADGEHITDVFGGQIMTKEQARKEWTRLEKLGYKRI